MVENGVTSSSSETEVRLLGLKAMIKEVYQPVLEKP